MASASQISVVDDDEDVRFALTGLLDSAGHNATAYASAEEALNDPAIFSSGCVITDLQMDGLDGIGLARRLRARNAALPILLITAFPTVDVERRARETDILFLSKPFEPNEMLDMVDEMLEISTHDGGRPIC